MMRLTSFNVLFDSVTWCMVVFFVLYTACNSLDRKIGQLDDFQPYLVSLALSGI